MAGGGVRWWGGGLLDVGYVEGVRWGEGVRWRGGGKLGRGGGGVVDVKSWSKMLYERVRSSFAEKRNVESGTSTREDRSKFAQKPLNNRSNLA